MKKLNFKRILAILLTLCLTLSLLPVSAFAATGAKDLDGHWAAAAIETCYTYGIMNGDGNGYYKPNDDITRAEFATMVNRAFGYDTLSVPELTGHKDVPASKWYANEVATIVATGYMVGYGGGRFGPEDKLTWEQAGIVFGKILRLDGEYATGKSGIITRGEAAQMLVDVFGVIVDESIDAQDKTYKNVTIRKAGVTLKNANITGDLFITEGVGDGDIWLDTVRIDGRLLATGGGENSIHVKDITVGDNVVVDKPPVAGEQPVRFRAIQTSDNTVIFQGTAREVIITDDIIIIIDNDGEKTVFNMFKPEDGTEKPTVIISDSASVEKVTAFVPTEIQGGGEVGKVEAHTGGVVIDAGVNVKPENIEAEKGIEVKVGGETVTGTGITEPTTKPSDPASPTDPTPAPTPDPTPTPTTPPSTGGGGNGGGSGGGTTTTNAKTPAISAQPQGASVTIGTTHTLTVSAGAADGGTLSYQWYSNTSASTSGGTAISGASSASYTAPINTAGTFYYYVVVTNTNNSVNGTKTASVTSNAVTLTVNLIPITSAAITVTAPAKGDTPNTTAGGTGNFNVGIVSWTPNDNPFQSGTQYTATVTLTADANYTFTGGLTTATINGYAANVTNNGVTAVLSYQFAATASKTVTGIAVKTQPTGLSYTHGDTLDLTGLEVTLTYDDTTTEDVALADFAAKNISAIPANGAALARSNHDGQPITVSCGSQSANTNSLAVGKAAAPVITFPGAATITYGATLSTSALTGGSTEYGTFAWTTGTTVPPVSNSGYQVTFTPSIDTLANYETIANTIATVPITVNKANLTLTVSGDNLVLTPFDNTAFTYNVTGLFGSDTASVTCTTSGVTVWTSYLYISGAVTSTDVTLGFTASAGNNYNNATATLPASVYDGRAAARAIPITNANLAKFLDYIHDGSQRTTVLSRHYKLVEDITLTEAWKPIGYNMGTGSYAFTGNFNGEGHTISNINITVGTHYKALFTEIGATGKVHNLKVTGSYGGASLTAGIAGVNKGTIQDCETNITLTATSNYSGGIASQNDGTIKNCVVKGSLTASASIAGGVVGLNSGIMENCFASGTINVTGSGGNVGGIVGWNNAAAASVKGCSFSGTLNSEHQYTGGIVGLNDGGMIDNSFTTGSVTVSTNEQGVGGIVGNSRANGIVKNCYSTGDVTSQGDYVGGILGFTDTTSDGASTITYCYSTGNVSGNGSVGGIAGGIRYGSVVEYCYATGEVTAATGGAAGIVAYHQDSAVNNCVALNPSVTAKAGVEIGMGRVSGTLGNTYMNATGSNNYAWSGMKIQYNTNTTPTNTTLDKGTGTKDGADLSAADAKTQTAWETAGFTFDADNWTWDNSNDYMPSLHGEQIAWPGYLVDGPEGPSIDSITVESCKVRITIANPGDATHAYLAETADFTHGINISSLNAVELTASGEDAYFDVTFAYIATYITGGTIKVVLAEVGGNTIDNIVAVSTPIGVNALNVTSWRMEKIDNNLSIIGTTDTNKIYLIKNGAAEWANYTSSNGAIADAGTWQTTAPVTVIEIDTSAKTISMPTALGTPVDFALPLDLSQLAAVTVTTSGSGLAEVFDTEDGYCWIGDTVTVTVTPDEGWMFSHWEDENGEIVSYDAEYTFVVTGDVTLTAVFTEDNAQPVGTQAEFQSLDPRKESDPIIVPDNDDESNDPDGGGDDGNDGDLPDSGANLPGGNGGEDAGRMTLQEAIATLNNLLAMCGTVTRG